MPKKIFFESAVHQFLAAGRRKIDLLEKQGQETQKLKRFVDALDIQYPGSRRFRITWKQRGNEKTHEYSFQGAVWYARGDRKGMEVSLLLENHDVILEKNKKFFDSLFNQVLEDAQMTQIENSAHFDKEESFHDEWANSVDVQKIDVIQMNEACTSPEMRYITQSLGNLKEKKLLDVGCGLGEAAVYFALQGAAVTATDISGGMLEATSRLAAKYKVSLKTHKSRIESLDLPPDELFDVIYVGNLFHHADIPVTVELLKKHLKPEGILASWDPVEYNPAINVYRRMASEVRTPDEHPFRLSDIKTFKMNFAHVDVKWFWLSTLIIFVLMYVAQKRNPNQERFWKKVVEEADRWKWLYLPLEKLDNVLLTVFPFLRPLCWNVVLISKSPRK